MALWAKLWKTTQIINGPLKSQGPVGSNGVECHGGEGGSADGLSKNPIGGGRRVIYILGRKGFGEAKPQKTFDDGCQSRKNLQT